MRTEPSPCPHNQRCRYTSGFYCEDCKTFFPKDSPTYRAEELLVTLWCALHNINARSVRGGGPEIADALAMRDKIGINKQHDDYEALILEAENVIGNHCGREGPR